MTLKERHEIAIIRMREHLFKVHSADALGVDLKTEKISEPIEASTYTVLGGLSYKMKDHPTYDLEIEHSGGSKFNIFICDNQVNGPRLTMIANEADARDLSKEATRLIKMLLWK